MNITNNYIQFACAMIDSAIDDLLSKKERIKLLTEYNSIAYGKGKHTNKPAIGEKLRNHETARHFFKGYKYEIFADMAGYSYDDIQNTVVERII